MEEVNRAGGIRGQRIELIASTPISTPESVEQRVSDAIAKDTGIVALVALSDTERDPKIRTRG